MFGIFGLEIAAASGVDLSVISQSISSFGKEAVSLAVKVIEAVADTLGKFFSSEHGKFLLSGGYFYSVVMSAKLGIQQLKNLSNLLEYLPGFWEKVRGIEVSIQVFDNFLFSHTITYLNGKGEPICGSTAFSNGDRYTWKLVDGVYYVLIKGEWVLIDDQEWRPGKPLPPGV